VNFNQADTLVVSSTFNGTNTTSAYKLIAQLGAGTTVMTGQQMGTNKLALVVNGGALIFSNAVYTSTYGGFSDAGYIYAGYRKSGSAFSNSMPVNMLITSNSVVSVYGVEIGYGKNGGVPNGNASNSLVVNGSTLTSDYFYVGDGGDSNTLLLTNGAIVTISGSPYIGRKGNGNRAFVTGTNTIWSASNMYLGYSGNSTNSSGQLVGLSNSLVISNGAKVLLSSGLYVGNQSGTNGNNTVLVTGTNSTLSNGGGMYLGYSENGDTVTVSDGAKLLSSNDYIGYNGGSSNSMLVTGAGSTYTNSGFLQIGSSNSAGNSLVISNGAKVLLSGALSVGYYGNGNNTVLVTGANSTLSNGGGMNLGYWENGDTVTVSDGAKLIGSNDYIGYATASNNTMIVTGSGSLYTNSGDLGIGDDGSGNSLVVSNGATVAVKGNITVSLSDGNTNNSVTIASGGTLTASNITIASPSGSSAVVNVGTYGGNDTNVTLGAPTITFGSGTGTVNFNQADTLVVSSTFNGTNTTSAYKLIAQLGAGTTVMTGQQMGTNKLALVVNGGALIFSNAVYTSTYGGFSDAGYIYAGYRKSGSAFSNSMPVNMLITSNSVVSVYGVEIGYGKNGGVPNGNASNSLVVNGSTLTSDYFYVGDGGDSNTLLLTNGAIVTISGSPYIGRKGNGNRAFVTGTNTIWSASNMYLGYSGNSTNSSGQLVGLSNSLVISNGAKVLLSSGLYVGNQSGTNGNNTVLVTGTNSTLSNGGGMYLGYSENGDTVTVSDGAKLYGSNDYIGYNGSSNSMLVTGAGSIYTNSGNLLIGSNGSGNSLNVSNGATVAVKGNITVSAVSGDTNNSVTIASGGTLTASNITIASPSGSSAVVNVGTFGGSDTNVTLNAQTITFSNGSYGSLNFNQADLLTNSSSLMGGNPNQADPFSANLIQQRGAGTTVLTGNSTNQAFVVVTGGQLTFNGGSFNNMRAFFPPHIYVGLQGMILNQNVPPYGTFSNSAPVSMVITNDAHVTTYQLDVGYGYDTNGLPTGNSNNSLLLTGSNSSLMAQIYVGNGGNSNRMVIDQGAQANCGGGKIEVGYDGNGNTLLVTNGGSLTAYYIYVGDGGSYESNAPSLGNNNTTKITGSNTTATLVYTYIGYSDNNGGNGNSLTIEQGATVALGRTTIGVGDYMQYGSSGNSNSINIQTGAKVTASSITVGNSYGDAYKYGNEGNNGNQLNISGGSTLSNSGTLRIGYSKYGFGNNSNSVNLGNATMYNGGLVTVGYATSVGYNRYGFSNTGGNNNSINLSSNSVFTAGGIIVGNGSHNTYGISGADSNTMTVNSSRVTNTGDLVIGFADSGLGGNYNSLTLTNGSFMTSSGNLYVGTNNDATNYSGGNGNTLTVAGASTLTVGGDATVGQGGSGNSILVTGAGSIYTNSGFLQIGNSGSGNSLVVSNGATVAVKGNITVSAVSGDTNNSVTVASGGTLTALNITIASPSGSSGALNIGTYGGSDTNATLNIPFITFGQGTGLLNFNQADTFTNLASIIGGGSVNQFGAGTTIMAANPEYTGTTTITNGTLLLNATHTNGSTYTVSGAGTLAGTGLTTSPLVVNSGGTVQPGSPGATGILTVGNLTISSGGNLNILLSGATSSLLQVTGNATLAGSTVNFLTNAVALTADIYTILDYSGTLTGTFAATNNLPANYAMVYDPTNTLIFLEKTGVKDFGLPIFFGTNAVITGGGTNFGILVNNTTASSISFSATNGLNTVGSVASNTVAASNVTVAQGLSYTGTNVGPNQVGNYTVNQLSNPTNSTNIQVTVNVYDHAQGSLLSNSASLGSAIVGFTAPLTAELGVTNGVGYRSTLGTVSAANNPNLTINDVNGLAGGSSGILLFSLAGQGVGSFTNTVAVTFRDAMDLNGASTNLGTTNVTLTGAIYDHAAPEVATNHVSLSFTPVHAGYTNAQTSTSFSVTNAAGFRVNLGSLNAYDGLNSNLSLGSLSGLTAGDATSISASLAAGQGVGLFTNTVGVTFIDDSMLQGASTNLGTTTVTARGYVYSGQSTWTAQNGGDWTSFSNWNLLGGTPGLDGALSSNDSATFNTSGLASGTGTVTLNTNAALSSLTFSNATASYVLGGSGTLTLQTAGQLNNLAGSNTITAALNLATNVTLNQGSNSKLTLGGSIGGAGGLTLNGGGTTVIAGSGSIARSTLINGGTLSVNGSLNSPSITANAGSTLGGSGTLTAQNGVSINGGGFAPSSVGANGMRVNANLTFTSATYLWNLFANSSTNAGTDFTAPVSLFGDLAVDTNSTLALNFTGSVNSGSPFWTNSQQWPLVAGTNALADGLNFKLAWAEGSGVGFNISLFGLTESNNRLFLNYFVPIVTNPVINPGQTNQLPAYTGESTALVINAPTNGTGVLAGSNPSLVSIVLNSGNLASTNQTSIPTNASVTVNNGTMGFTGPGTNTIGSLFVSGGQVAASNTIVNVQSFVQTGGTLSGGSNATYWAGNYYFAATNPASVDASLDNLGTVNNHHSTAIVTTNSSGDPVAPVVFQNNMNYDGGTIITQGILQLGDSNSGGPITVQGIITNNGVLNYGYNGDSTTPTNTVLGGGIIGQVGTGTLTVGSVGVGTNFTGSFAAANGTLQITTNSALGSSTNYYLAENGALQFTPGITTVTNSIQVTNGTGIVENASGSTLALNGTLTKSGTVLVLAGGDFEVNGQVTGSGAPDSFNSDLVVSNATVLLNNGNNNYTGPTYVIGGSTLRNGVENALPTNTILTLGALSDGVVVNTYDLNPNNQTIAALASAGGATNIVQASTQGSQTLTINGAQSTTYGGLIQSAVALIRSGTGNTTLTGANTYSGGTTIRSGSLTTANVTALGSGGVSLNGGRLIVQSLLNIASLNWNGAGVIALPNAGSKQYIAASGNLVISGSKNTFDLAGLHLKSTPVELLASANMHGFNTNEFAATGVTDYSLLISNNALWIEALGSENVSYPNLLLYAVNRNQTNVAKALNSFTNKPNADQTVVLNTLTNQTETGYQQVLNATMPSFYQQMATIAFNSANAQNMELAQRLWGMRVAEGGGFSMTGFADNTPMVQEGQGDGEAKGVLDAKKDILRPGLDNRWGMFLDANGIFANANSANILPGYQSESGGVTTGLTYKWNKNVASGLYAGYQGTYNKSGANGSGLGVGSTLIDNAVRFGVFGTYGQVNSKGEPLGLYVNALAGGAYNNYQASRIIDYPGLNRTANSSPGAGELDTMLGGGYDVKCGNLTFGPTASLQYTYLGANGVNETGAQSLDFNSAGWNSSSLLSSVGAHAAYNWYLRKLEGHEVVVVPQVNLNWQHEFMQNPYAINGNLGGTTPTFSNWSATPTRDFLYTGVGFTVEFSKKWNTSFFYNAAAGNQNLQSQNIFWSAGVKF
jgi:T5SS/PEP-CTERM-associated repeat protein